MDYSQFLDLLPEAGLVLTMLVLFFVDLCMKGSRKITTLGAVAAVMLFLVSIPCVMTTGQQTVFSGLYQSAPYITLMKLILAAGTIIVVLMAKPWLETSASKLAGEFFFLIVSTLLGMYMMLSAGHFLMFFLGLEMASVPLACMVAFDKKKRQSAEAAAKFVLTATFSSGVMLFGISFIYAATGTLYFDTVSQLVGTPDFLNSHLALLIIGLVFFFSGLGFKISLVPFHFWTADTYQGAPTAVTGYLSVISKGAAALALCTILIHVFGGMKMYWQPLLYVVIVLSITIANLFAIRQRELKRFMAFSSISQAGYIMLAVVGANNYSITALIYYVLVYIVANMAVFTVIGVVENKFNTTKIASLNGFYQTNPRLSFITTLALFSLAGIPPFAGMFSKFFVFMAAAQQGSVWAYVVVFVALINTVVSLYYYLLIVKAMFIKPSNTSLPTFQSDFHVRLALAICTVGIVLFGVCSCFYEYIFASTL